MHGREADPGHGPQYLDAGGVLAEDRVGVLGRGIGEAPLKADQHPVGTGTLATLVAWSCSCQQVEVREQVGQVQAGVDDTRGTSSAGTSVARISQTVLQPPIATTALALASQR